jgi:hypothetical protein
MLSGRARRGDCYYRFISVRLSDVPSIRFTAMSHKGQDVADRVGPLLRQHATTGMPGIQ